MPGLLPHDRAALEQLRSAVRSDAALQAELAAIYDPDRLAEAIAAVASARGLVVSRDEIWAMVIPDPLGSAHRMPAQANAREWPSRAWLPCAVNVLDSPFTVTWAHLAGERLTRPFFEESAQRAVGRPFNRVFPYRVTVEDFVGRARFSDALAPSGFIFHMSRCGSTLVAQMLAAVPRNIIVSEAPPLDAIVRMAARGAFDPTPALKAMVAGLGRPRYDERHYVLKLDCWHTLALPLLRAAFPTVPWVFLYRDPVEVMVSLMHKPGVQVVRGSMAESLFAIDGGAVLTKEEYCARVLETTCAAVLDNWPLGGGLVVNYSELPDAVWSKIMPHFGLPDSEGDRVQMSRAARQNAKAPHEPFTGDSAAKQRAATPAIREAVDRHLADVYRHLEAQRAG